MQLSRWTDACKEIQTGFPRGADPMIFSWSELGPH